MEVRELFDKIDAFKRCNRSVLIHPGVGSFYEFDIDFIDSLKKELEREIILAANDIDDLNVITKFAIEILRDAW